MGGADKKKLVNNTVILKTFNVIRHLKIIEALFTKTNKKKQTLTLHFVVIKSAQNGMGVI